MRHIYLKYDILITSVFDVPILRSWHNTDTVYR